ncbi:MAG: Flp pilus assembly complex ATPase component TadA [Rhodopseudomonas palustris]|nr:Flp pilus assembly complex ATPase component TadA [Rhodopseudomonas palustris]
MLRILDRGSVELDLESLGIPDRERTLFRKILNQPNGLILVTGPTGSGKTTTLYAALQYLASDDVNIVTVEDPIEYDLPRTNQTQVNPRVDYSFAEALRSILRQDPDMIMVGEIRDAETLSIAVRASITGHLVLSTLHTNSSIGAIPRLLDLGIEPFLRSCASSQ